MIGGVRDPVKEELSRTIRNAIAPLSWVRLEASSDVEVATGVQGEEYIAAPARDGQFRLWADGEGPDYSDAASYKAGAEMHYRDQIMMAYFPHLGLGRDFDPAHEIEARDEEDV